MHGIGVSHKRKESFTLDDGTTVVYDPEYEGWYVTQ